MNKKLLIEKSICILFICTIIWGNINDCVAQENASSIALEIDRLVVKNGQGFNYQWEWEPYVAAQWGLVKRTKRIPYYDMGKRSYITQEYWGWDGETITNETLSNGSTVTTSRNRYIQTSLNLHPEYLYVTFSNLTSYYIGVDLSTAMISISYPEDHPDWGTKRYEVSESMLILNNTLGTPYHYIVIPPYKSLTSGHFIAGYDFKGAEFISPNIHNNSRLDLSIQLGIFRSNPLILHKSLLENIDIPWQSYSYPTPTKVQFPYKGGYFEDTNGGYYIYEECIEQLGSPDLRIEEQIICRIKKSSNILPIVNNQLGFKEFKGNVVTSVESKNTPSNDNSLVSKEDEPRGNLGHTLSQLRQKYPSLRYVRKNGNMDEYEYGNRTYSIKNSICVCESISYYKNGYSLYLNAKNQLEKTPYTRKSDEIDNSTRSIMYYYSESSVALCYWKSDGTYIITYQSYDYWK